MNVILGFGKTHFDDTKRVAQALADAIVGKNEDEIKAAIEAAIEERGTFKDTGWKRLSAHASFFSDYDRHFGCVIEGKESHYRDDHPMSPDGIAMMGVPFCITYQSDDIWGERVFVSTMQ